MMCLVTECAECGFVYEDLPVREIADTLRGLGERYRAELAATSDPALRTRPAPRVWSPLEYACHVRDVLLVQRERVIRTLVEECPAFPRMHREERVALAGYAEESPESVADQMAMAADLLARVFAGMSAEQYDRPCLYNFPESAERDLAWVGRHTVHEGEHHLRDMRTG